MGRSKVYSANNFRGHPPLGGDPEGQGKKLYAYDNLPGPVTNQVKFRENRPRGFRDIAVLVVDRRRKKTKKGKKKEKMAVAICPLFSKNWT